MIGSTDPQSWSRISEGISVIQVSKLLSGTLETWSRIDAKVRRRYFSSHDVLKQLMSVRFETWYRSSKEWGGHAARTPPCFWTQRQV